MAERLDIEAGSPDSPSRAGSGAAGLLWSIVPGLCLRCHKLASEVLRRIKLEVIVELPMLRQRWLIILFGLIMQYVHGMATATAHRMHRPSEEPLHDVGFDLTPELGPDKFWVSEAIFGTLFISFVVWSFTPFLLQRKRFYTVVMWSRLLMVLVVCQVLRVITFSVTQLPGPSYHCRAGEATAVRPWPEHWTGHLILDLGRGVTKSCGDLIFSSHTIFMLTGILAYNEYGSWAVMKAIAWVAGAIVSTLIVASRKHYTVDVVIAWYTVPLVFYTLHRRWTTRRPMSDAFLGAIGENDEPDPSTPEGGASMDGSSLGFKVAAGMGMGQGAQAAGAHHAHGMGMGMGASPGGGGGGVCVCAKCGGSVVNGHPVDQVMVDIKGLGDQAYANGHAAAVGGGKPALSQPKGRSISMLKLTGLGAESGNGAADESSALLNGGGAGNAGHGGYHQQHHGGVGAGAGGSSGSNGVGGSHHGHRTSSMGSSALGMLAQHLQQLVAPGGAMQQLLGGHVHNRP